MRWIRSPLSLVKNSAVSTAIFTMVFSPVAQGASAKAASKANSKLIGQGAHFNIDKKAVQEYLKLTGLNNGKRRVSVGEVYSKVRPGFPKRLQQDMDRWVRANRNEIMPSVEVTTFKGRDGKEQVRLLFTKDKQTHTISFNPESHDNFVKFNNVSLSRVDLLMHDQAISKVIYGDKSIRSSLEKVPTRNPLKQSIALGYEEFQRLTPRQRAQYMVRLRYLMESGERVFKAFYGKQAFHDFEKEFFARWFLGEEAQAAGKVRGAGVGEPCIVAGYVSVYGENYSCGGKESGAEDLKYLEGLYGAQGCSSTTVSCNPFVYGYKKGPPYGQPICVSRANKLGALRDATSNFCPKESPLRKGTPQETADKERIIESWMAAKGKKIDLVFKDGKLPKDQYDLVIGYVNDLNAYVDKAIKTCETVPLIDIKEVRDEQMTACEGIRLRKMEIQYYPTGPVGGGGVIGEKDCSAEKPGSIQDENGNCICPPDTQPGPFSENGQPERESCIVPIPLPIPAEGGKEQKKECNSDQKRDEKTGECVAICGFWCGPGKWIAGGLVGLGILALLWPKGGGDDKDKPKHIDPCPPAPAVCMPTPVTPSPGPTAEPGPITPGPAPEIPPPQVPPFVEATDQTSSSTAGGVERGVK